MLLLFRAMSNEEAFRTVLDTYDRAKEHFLDFETRLTRFHETHPNIIKPKSDPKTGDVTYYVARSVVVPRRLSIVFGEALQSYRSALDYLVNALVRANGKKPTTQTGFPIFDTYAVYRHRNQGATRKVEGMTQEAIKVIRAAKPYKRGNYALWLLRALNDASKHRKPLRLRLAVIAQTATKRQFAEMQRAFAISHPSESFPLGVGTFHPATPSIKLLKQGDKIRTVPATEADDNLKFLVDVAVAESSILKPRTADSVFTEINAAVHKVIFDCQRFF